MFGVDDEARYKFIGAQRMAFSQTENLRSFRFDLAPSRMPSLKSAKNIRLRINADSETNNRCHGWVKKFSKSVSYAT
jgi:hypothetical protein